MEQTCHEAQNTGLVSVVIPCHGQGHFLREAIESVLTQTHDAYEIIVVDDGAPDRDVIARVLAPYGDRVQCIRQENTGLSGARNAGLARARGEFVVCLDADDRLLPNALAAGVAAWRAYPDTGLVWGFRRLIDARGLPLDREAERLSDGSYATMLVHNAIGPPVGVMFRRRTLLDVGAFCTTQRFAEDYELFLRIVRTRGAQCHGHLVAEYRVHDGNMSRNDAGMLQGLLLALDRQRDWIGNDAVLQRAWRTGRRSAREAHDFEPRLGLVAAAVRAGRWGPALRGIAILLLRYPRPLAMRLARRVMRAVQPMRGRRRAGPEAVPR